MPRISRADALRVLSMTGFWHWREMILAPRLISRRMLMGFEHVDKFRPAVQFRWLWNTDRDDTETRFHQFGSVAMFDALRRLSIDFSLNAAYEQDWVHILSQMHAIESIDIIGWQGSKMMLLPALRRTLAPAAAGAVNMLCPNLTSFRVLPGCEIQTSTLEELVVTFKIRSAFNARLAFLEATLSRDMQYDLVLVGRVYELAETVVIHGHAHSWPFPVLSY
ncbi:hypothetical protein AcW1_006694 [Taiwanofungus camphoratus]|nr:hypothetical protein AcV5_009281 [Antrodia cinnamomea]KAI0954964.1 hypothetical protein AcW1_006694 [Antrodia cinnamomea]